MELAARRPGAPHRLPVHRGGRRDASRCSRSTDLVKRFELRRAAVEPARAAGPPPALTAVDDVSLSLDRHRTLGIVGESGSGKTTLARCLTRLVEPDEGSVVFDGTESAALAGKELQRHAAADPGRLPGPVHAR